MAYIVYNSNGTILVNIPNGDVDQETTSLDLIGKNVNNYGEFFNNNLVRLLTSSADTNSPRSPQPGQLWYDTSMNQLKVYDGDEFNPVYASEVSGSPPVNISEGDFWYDSGNQQFKVYASGWKVIGPAVSASFGKFGIVPPDEASIYVTDYPSGNQRSVGLMYSNGYVVGVISTTTFDASVASTNYYFTGTNETNANIVRGFNLPDDLKVFGDVVVKGSLTLYGQLGEHPRTYLSSYYDRSWIGSSITDSYTATNNFIRLEILPYVFSTGTSNINLNSEVKVLTSYNTSTEVRHFRLEQRVPSVNAWESYEIYSTTGTSYWSVLGNTNTNVVKLGV